MPEGYPEAECYIIPPYKPLLYISVQSESNAVLDIYTLRGEFIFLSQFVFTLVFWLIEEEKGSNMTKRDNGCNNLTPELLKKCVVVGPPVSYDYPIHPFFLTASRKVVNNKLLIKALLHHPFSLKI